MPAVAPPVERAALPDPGRHEGRSPVRETSPKSLGLAPPSAAARRVLPSRVARSAWVLMALMPPAWVASSLRTPVAMAPLTPVAPVAPVPAWGGSRGCDGRRRAPRSPGDGRHRVECRRRGRRGRRCGCLGCGWCSGCGPPGKKHFREAPGRRRGWRLGRRRHAIQPFRERIEVQDHARHDHGRAVDRLDGEDAIARLGTEAFQAAQRRRTVGIRQLIQPVYHHRTPRRLLLGDETPDAPLVEGLQYGVF